MTETMLSSACHLAQTCEANESTTPVASTPQLSHTCCATRVPAHHPILIDLPAREDQMIVDGKPELPVPDSQTGWLASLTGSQEAQALG